MTTSNFCMISPPLEHRGIKFIDSNRDTMCKDCINDNNCLRDHLFELDRQFYNYLNRYEKKGWSFITENDERLIFNYIKRMYGGDEEDIHAHPGRKDYCFMQNKYLINCTHKPTFVLDEHMFDD